MASIKRRSFIGGLFASTLAFLTPFSKQERVVAKEIADCVSTCEQNRAVTTQPVVYDRSPTDYRYSLNNISRIIRENRNLQLLDLSLDQIRHLTLEERDILVGETDWNLLEPTLHKIMNRLVPNRPKRPMNAFNCFSTFPVASSPTPIPSGEDGKVTSWVKFYIPKKDQDV